MSAYPYLPLWTAAFISSTTHLSAEETGAYMMLLMMAWESPDCSLPDDDRRLAAWARMDAKTWRTVKPVVMEFWTLTDGRWTQKRLLKERAHVVGVSERRRAAAQKRWGANVVQLHSNGSANDMHSHLHTHSHLKKKGSRKVTPLDRGVPPTQVGVPGSEGVRAREALDGGGDE